MRYARRVQLKRVFGSAAPWTCWPAVQRRLARSRTLILTYHGVACGLEDSYVTRQSVDASVFDAHLAWLSRRYRFVPLAELVSALEQRTPLTEPGVVITFDDGLRNVLRSALPILRKHGAPATVFVCSDYVNRGPLWTDEVALLVMRAPIQLLASPVGDGVRYPLRGVVARERAAKAITASMKRLDPLARAEVLRRVQETCRPSGGPVDVIPECHDLLTWDEVRALADAGIEIGSHGRTHTVLTALEGIDARDEIVRSKETIERELGRPCTLFSYPNGSRHDFGPEHQQMLIEAGYRAAATQIVGVNGHRSPLTELRRVNVARVAGLGYLQAAIARAGWQDFPIARTGTRREAAPPRC
jgi:peptidoglycan/xylan/chitin deacetylase (PgdA/CDA1 family)